jgi:hypothetical protein
MGNPLPVDEAYRRWRKVRWIKIRTACFMGGFWIGLSTGGSPTLTRLLALNLLLVVAVAVVLSSIDKATRSWVAEGEEVEDGMEDR